MSRSAESWAPTVRVCVCVCTVCMCVNVNVNEHVRVRRWMLWLRTESDVLRGQARKDLGVCVCVSVNELVACLACDRSPMCACTTWPGIIQII